MRTCIFLLFAVYAALPVFSQKEFELKSPDGKLRTKIIIDKTVAYSIIHGADTILYPSPLSMTLAGGKTFGIDSKLAGSSARSVNKEIASPIYKKESVRDHYNELTLRFKEKYSLEFKAYNDGVAYRFVSNLKENFLVENEQVELNFGVNPLAYIPYVRDNATKRGNEEEVKTIPFDERQFYNSFENVYAHTPLSEWRKDAFAFLPMVVECANGKKACIVEADLMAYPGMYLTKAEGSNRLKGIFPRYPKEIRQGGHNRLQGEVVSREEYIARATGTTSFPWRAIVVSEKDVELVDNDMVYKLASPSRVADYSWIKPGKVAWDWWNAWNLHGVNFETGINNETYKYYIDFASEYGIEYVILDEGWAVNLQADLFQIVPEIDLKELVAYANQRGVGLILWGGYLAFVKDMEGICKHYSEMGIKGFKLDFMDRDDQPMVEFHEEAARIAAGHKLLIDFHGTYKPTGLQRTYPNVVNFEGVFGLEQMKWSDESVDQVLYDVTMPFIRMVAGPVDYTQGAMRNASKGNYRPIRSEAMSQGTRCRQLSEYIIFESPLNMLCDSPSNYMDEEECAGFISAVPTVWDKTIALNGEIGKYVSIARQKDGVWYVGSLTNWDKRELTLDLSFLGEGDFKAEVFRDGINAHRIGRDYVKENITIPTDRKLKITMAPGGGCVLRIAK